MFYRTLKKPFDLRLIFYSLNFEGFSNFKDVKNQLETLI